MVNDDDDGKDIKFWLSEIDDAKKRDKGYIAEGKRINEIYNSNDKNKAPFNILYSNTDTLLPALYSAVPRPEVRGRHKDTQTPLTQAAARAAQGMLEYLLDTNTEGYETFHEGVLSATLDALLPGRGVTRIRYDAEIGEEQEDMPDSGMPDDDESSEREPIMTKESETVGVDSVGWDKMLVGYATKWSKVPWIAFEEVIDKEEATRLFGPEMAAKIQYTKGDDSDDKDKQKQDGDKGGIKTAVIYQIWDKDGGKKVRYVSIHYKDEFLKVEDDPLELTGFYPIPMPMQLIAKSNNMAVTAPYLVYESQAKEINELTLRIRKLAKAIKAKFVYDAELGGDIANLMSGEDLDGIPADKSAALSSDKGFENALWFLPIEKMVNVLRELYTARDAAKQVIYEVTGISDIIRGATDANETAAAQGLKSQWGTMRLRRSQGEVQRYCRDLLRIMLEIAASKFSQESWVSMTGLNYATDDQIMKAQYVMKATQQYQAMMQQRPQQQDPSQPQQTQIPPQIQQEIQNAQQVLSLPAWSQVIDLLKNDCQRAYNIDIETNSTVLPQAIEDQKNIADVMTALGQYLQGITPLIQEGAFPFEAARAMMIAVIRRYQFGNEIEEYINQMKPPAPPQPPPTPPDNTALELQAKQQSEQMASQLEQQKLEATRVIEQGRAQTQIHIEQMRVDSAEKIALFQAKIDSETRITIAQMQGAALERDAQAASHINEDGSVYA